MTSLCYASETIGELRKNIEEIRASLDELVPSQAPQYQKFAICRNLKKIEDTLFKEIEEIENYGKPE